MAVMYQKYLSIVKNSVPQMARYEAIFVKLCPKNKLGERVGGCYCAVQPYMAASLSELLDLLANIIMDLPVLLVQNNCHGCHNNLKLFLETNYFVGHMVDLLHFKAEET